MWAVNSRLQLLQGSREGESRWTGGSHRLRELGGSWCCLGARGAGAQLHCHSPGGPWRQLQEAAPWHFSSVACHWWHKTGCFLDSGGAHEFESHFLVAVAVTTATLLPFAPVLWELRPGCRLGQGPLLILRSCQDVALQKPNRLWSRAALWFGSSPDGVEFQPLGGWGGLAEGSPRAFRLSLSPLWASWQRGQTPIRQPAWQEEKRKRPCPGSGSVHSANVDHGLALWLVQQAQLTGDVT